MARTNKMAYIEMVISNSEL